MRRFIDLHTHSTASDGELAPAELIRCADEANLAAVALTDHDTLGGLAEASAAAGDYPDLKFVGGLEISAKFPRGHLHILAYGIDETAEPLLRITERFRAARNERNPRIIAKLQALGVDITMDDVVAAARREDDEPDPIISRVHMARALREAGHVRTNQEAFDRYLGSTGAAFVDKEVIEPDEAIAAIRECDALAVLAHPVQLKCDNHAQLERVVRELVRLGIQGIEAYHSDHTPELTRAYIDLAKKHDLGITGGSDFHGAPKPDVRLGHPRVPVSAVGEAFAERLFG